MRTVTSSVLALLAMATAFLAADSDQANAGFVPYLVDTTSDAVLATCDAGVDNDCSMRGALTKANMAATPGDMIVFDAADFPAPPSAPGVITIGSALPSLTNSAGNDTIDATGRGVVIDGISEPSLFPCLILENTGNAVKGLQITDCTSGISISGSNNTIGPDNVLFDHRDFGISIGGATGNIIKGNKIGTSADGTAVNVNGGNPIGININASGNTVGGAAPADRNIISGNTTGINISGNGSNNNAVRGNYIGTDVTGTVDLGNVGSGVNIAQAANSNVIGGPVAGEGNLISGNNANGVRFFGSDAIGRPSGALVQGNLIGTDAGGTADLGNSLDGVLVEGGTGNCIGGTILVSACITAAGARNFISGNDSDGVQISGTGAIGNVVLSNYVGTDSAGVGNVGNTANGILINGVATNTAGGPAEAANRIAFNGGDGVRVSGAAASGNTVRGNSIHSNAGKGIENISGGNSEPGHAPPVITSAGSASGTACVNCTIDVYSDSADEGRVYHGSTVVDGSGNWSFAGPVVGPNVTATATNASGSTSEFSAPFACSDADADAVCNSGDNCPSWPNPAQNFPPWPVPAGDSDCDGFSDSAEGTLGTDPVDQCPDNASDDAWPPDINMTGAVSVTDVLFLKPFFGQAVPPAPARYDIVPSLAVNITDVVEFKKYFGLGCT